MSHTPVIERFRIAFASRDQLMQKAQKINGMKKFDASPRLRQMRDRRIGAVAYEDLIGPTERFFAALFV